MANKLQQAAKKRLDKHVPAEGSNLWVEGIKDLPHPFQASPEHLLALRKQYDFVYMGMKDLKAWLHDLEVYITGDASVPAMEEMRLELANAKQRIADLEKRLNDALREV